MSKTSQSAMCKRAPSRSRFSGNVRATAVALLALLASGCNDYPVHSLLDSFGARVTKQLKHDKPINLDFLWVIDHSTSMCKQQRILSQGFNDFITNLGVLGQVDVRMAVVTVQQIADPASATGVTVKKVGEFNHTAAKEFPPNCIEHYRAPCFVDGPGDVTTPSAQCQSGFNLQFTAGKNYQLPATALLNVVMPPDPVSDSTGNAQHAGPAYGDAMKHYGPTLLTPDISVANEWRCVQPPAFSQVTNDNASINSQCQRHCVGGKQGDDECKSLFGPTAVCYTPSGNPAAAGCMFPPSTSDCPPPDQLPSVLHNDQLNMFHCIATVGASSTPQAGFEGGLRSAWKALDPAGPNCPGGPILKDGDGNTIMGDDGQPAKNPNCQYAQLVRDDSYLVIVVVSDDDDCSVDLNLSLENSTVDEKNKLSALLPKEDWDKCQGLGDAVGGNRRLNEGNCLYVKSKCGPANPGCPDPTKYLCPTDCALTDAACLMAAEVNVQANAAVDKRFAPVSDFVNRFKSLKSDPAHVIVAAISGDSEAQVYVGGQPQFDLDKNPLPDEAQKVVDTSMYFKSKRHNAGPKQTPYVCAGSKGESGYGSRYIELVNAFRENGIFANICAGSDFSAPLNGIASTILKRTNKVCLPYPPAYADDGTPILEVKRTRLGETEATTLQYTANPVDHAVDHFYLQASPDCRPTSGQIEGESQPCKSIKDCSPGLSCIDCLCRLYSEAIYFTEVPHDGDALELNYGADLGLTATSGSKKCGP